MDKRHIFFANNSANSSYSDGGAFSNSGTLIFDSNRDITFSGNSATSSYYYCGGAVYNSGTLTFSGNSSVLFEKNYEKRSSSYRLRSIYSSSGSLYLAANEGGYITFKDSIYSSGECAFNAYLDENGGLITSFGEIVFTGESTEADLEEIMGSAPTSSQITTSRTSELTKASTLYGGTLSIREQAILKGAGLTVQTSATEGGTRVSLDNGTLSMSGNSITFQRGTVLDVQGASSVSGNITMAANSTLRFTPGAAGTAVLTLTGTLVQEGDLLISIAGNASAGTYTLLSVSNAFDMENWTEARVSVTGAEFRDLRWDTQGKNLYLDYKGASGLATDVVWNGGSGAWNSFAKNWQAGANASQFVNGMNARFTDAGAGSVSITENLAPDSITVENSTGKDYTFFGTGRISGYASLIKRGQGTLTINNANSYTGDTRIEGGTLVIGHAEALGHGVVTLVDGTLDIGVFRPHNDFVLNGGKVVLRETESGLQIGKLTIGGNEVAIDYGDLSDHLTGESYTLATLESGSTGDGSKLTLVNSNLASGYSFEIKDDALVLNLEKRDATTLTWNAKQSTWGQRADGDLWQTPSGVNDGHFHNGDTVVITVGDDITVADTVNPAAVKVQATSGTVRFGGSGSITGSGTLHKSGNSTLILDTANSYTGGTVMEAGVLQVGNAAALGSGRVTLTGGTLDMVGLAVGNTVQIGKDALATIVNGGNYAGTARLSGGTLYLKGAFGGDLILNGGLLDLTGLDSMQLGTVVTSSLTQINVGDISGFGEGSHTLLSIVDGSGINTSLLQIVGMDGITEWNKALEIQDGNLVLVLSAITSPTDDIILGGGDKVLDDEVTPDHIEIGGDDDSSITGGGSIAGDGTLDKDGSGTLNIDTENPNWNGDININDGTVIAGNENALGTGDVNLNGGDLDLGGNSIGNDINVNTDATINGGENYQGELTLNDGTVNGGTINLGQDATVNNGTINNNLTGEGGINKETDGTVTLGGDNSFKGDVNVNDGTLIAGTNTALGTGDVKLNGGTLNMGGWDLGNDIIVVQDSVLNGAGDYRGTLTLRNGTLNGGSINIAAGKTFVLENGTLSNKLTGEGGIVKVTNGTVILTGNNTFAGGATISAGTLTLGSASALGTGTVTLEGGTLNLNGKAAANAITATSGTIGGASAYTGSLTIEGSVTLGGTTKAGSITLTTGSLTGGSITNTTITADGGSIASSITGGSIVNVTGDTSLSGANSYTGGTSISGGALLSVEHARALGNGAVSLQNGILDLGGMAVNNTVNIGKGELGTIVNGANYTGTVNLNGGTLNLTQALGGSITLNGGLLDLTGLSTMAVDATLSTVTLGTVTTSALTQINVGDVSGLGEGTYSLLSFADGSGIDTSLLQVAGLDSITGWNKALEIQGNDLVLVLSALATPSDDILLDGTNKVLEGIVTPGTIQVVGDGNSSITGGGSIAGDGTLDKTGNGTLTIDTENPDWNGDININSGTVIAGNGNALGTGDIYLNGGTLHLGGNGTTNDIIGTGGTLAGAENYNGWLTVDGNVTLAGETHADGLTMESGILTGGSIHDTDITANGGWIISDITGNGSLTNTGDTTLFGDNSYSGGTTINSGTLTAASENALGTGDVTLNGGTLHLGGNGVGNNITVQGDSTLNGGGAYTGTLTLKGGTLTGDGINIAPGKTFVLENGTLSNKLTGEGGVSKVTDGSVTLGGANSYSGGTVINAGTLVAGSDKAFGTGSVTVNGGTLDINGKGVGNSILLNNGATLRGASSAKDITIAAGAGVNMAGHSINAGQTLTTLGGNSISGGITFNGGTIVMKTPNLTFTDVVSIAGGSVTTLDVSAIASTLNTDGLNTLISFDGGLENYTDGCLTLVGVDNTLTQTLTVEEGKLVLALSTPATPPPAVTPAYNVEPSTLGGNRSTVYKLLLDGNRNAELDGELAAVAHVAESERDAEKLKQTLDSISGVLYTTQMSAQIDGNRAALGTIRGMMGYGKPLCPRTDDWRFAVQATSANSSLDRRADAPGYTRRGFGAVILAETMLDDGIVAGISLGYEHADVSVNGLDKWKSDDVRFNAHLLMDLDGWQSRTILGFGKHDYDVTRRLGIGDAVATSSPSGTSINFMQEFSYTMELDEESAMEPFFRVESSYNTIDAISETGTAGNAALRIGKQEAWATTLTIGTRYSQVFTLDGLLNPSRLVLEAGVSKIIGAENDTLDMHFAGAPAHTYRLTPAGRDRCSATLGGSLLFPIDESQSINVSGSIQLRSHQTDYNASVGYSITF